MAKPLMAKATAVWLVDNTSMTFKQISDFCGLHELEVSGIADGEVAVGIKGFDPIANKQLTADEIAKAEADPGYKLQLLYNPASEGEQKRRGPRYTPLSKRQERPAAILWLVKYHPELTDGQISKLVGTTKPTIQSLRERTHWNIANIQPIDPVALGMCKQMELDAAVKRAAKRVEKANKAAGIVPVEGETLMPTDQSLAMAIDDERPSNIPEGIEAFSFSDPAPQPEPEEELDADSFFNLPKSSDSDED